MKESFVNSQYFWHSLPTKEVLEILQSNAAQGLSEEEAKKRFIQMGPNSLPEPQLRSIFSILLHQFLSPLIYLLLLAAGIAFFIGEARDALVILVVVFLNAIIGSFQEGRAEHSLAALRKLSKLKAHILRGGKEQLIEAGDVVPGDILILDRKSVV
jgi:magnesium-transporting ATPase (P-type)